MSIRLPRTPMSGAVARATSAAMLVLLLAGCGGGGGGGTEVSSSPSPSGGAGAGGSSGDGSSGSGGSNTGGGAGGGGTGGNSGGNSGSNNGGGTDGNANSVVIGPDVSQIQPASGLFCSDLILNQFAGTACTLLTTSILPNGNALDAGVGGPGTVTTASIRVGPTTGRMRFVRLANLYSHGSGPKCCSPVQYGAIFVPQPNAVTTVTLNFPMVWEPVPPQTNNTIIRQDRIGIEILDAGVPFPITPFGGNASSFVWRPALSLTYPAGTLEVPIPSSPAVQPFIPTFSYRFVRG